LTESQQQELMDFDFESVMGVRLLSVACLGCRGETS